MRGGFRHAREASGRAPHALTLTLQLAHGPPHMLLAHVTPSRRPLFARRAVQPPGNPPLPAPPTVLPLAAQVVVLRCPSTRRGWAAHYDDATVASDLEALLGALEGMQQPEAYLAGGYTEPSGLGEQVGRPSCSACAASVPTT